MGFIWKRNCFGNALSSQGCSFVENMTENISGGGQSSPVYQTTEISLINLTKLTLVNNTELDHYIGNNRKFTNVFHNAKRFPETCVHLLLYGDLGFS